MDSDSMLAYPVTCQALFDEQGRPYSHYWPDFDYGQTRQIAEKLLGGYAGDFMTVFPQIYPRWMFAKLRAHMEQTMKVSTDHAIWSIHNSYDHASLSQFHIFGNFLYLK
jgi:hypothetical protein